MSRLRILILYLHSSICFHDCTKGQLYLYPCTMTATYVVIYVYAYSAGLMGILILADEEMFTLPEIRETISLEDRIFLSPENVL